ncbi:CHAP domain-containing protein [Oscillibacter sp.]|uniref:CHAP domain-containing protein n=1 Tax=Oscillibacter sp. TaxID=1945593 RepID=UPI001B7AC700|nr:CHAP domain-containing protein [Oscillibacter sp.]MBP3510028.1 CHAP domain-containing protein [Oscillibacter sp.]
MATAKDILSVARSELGCKESPAGSNRTKYGAWYGLDGQPWCMMFIQWVFAQAGAALPVKTASCGTFMRAAQAAGRWVTSNYQPGDVVIYDFPGGGATDHCGIVEQLAGGGIMAIEGNTGAGNDADGGQVQRRPRSNKVIVGAFRPSYDVEETEDNVMRYTYLKDIPEKFRPIINDLMTAGIIQGDGSDPAGNGDIINLTHEQVRTLVFVYRGGGFDAKLMAVGLEPAIQQ